VAINQISRRAPAVGWLPWLVAGLLLFALCLMMLQLAGRNGTRLTLEFKSIEPNDKEVLAFLLAYMLPLISSESMAFRGDALTSVYILLLILVAFTHAGALHFNPLMGLCGYHFYTARNEAGAPVLLISRKRFDKANVEVSTVNMAPGIYMEVGDQSAH
jgi:hypothetical protein